MPAIVQSFWKLAPISMNSTLITETYKEAYIPLGTENTFTLLLEYVPCIYYLVRFKKNKAEVQTLLNSDNEVNIITPAYTARLGQKIQLINVVAQKFNSSTL